MDAHSAHHLICLTCQRADGGKRHGNLVNLVNVILCEETLFGDKGLSAQDAHAVQFPWLCCGADQKIRRQEGFGRVHAHETLSFS